MIQISGFKQSKNIANEIQKIIDSGWIGCGKTVAEFEELFSNRINKSFVMTNNGSNALHLAVKLLNLPPHSKIILPAFTFITCIHSILLENHIPVLCDVELDGNMSCQTISKVFTKDVKAIMVVHYSGKPVDVEKIKEFGVPIIEDVAHAVDSKIDNKYCGSLGDIGVFSFDPIKNISTPDSGGISIKKELMEDAKKLRHFGVLNTGFDSKKFSNWWNLDVSLVFPKYTPNDISACFAIDQLKLLPENQKIRKKIWAIYQKELPKLLEIEEEPPLNIQHSHFTYLIKIKEKRNELAQHLKQNNIYTTLRFQSIDTYSLFSSYAKDLKNCDILNKTALNLPIHPSLSDNDIDKIIEVIKKWSM